MRRSALASALAFGALLVTGAAAFNRRMGDDEGVAAVMWRRNLQQSDSGSNDTSITLALFNATGLLSNTTNSTLLVPDNDAYTELAGFLSSSGVDLGNFTTLLQGGDNDNLSQNLTDLFSSNNTLSTLVTTILQLHIIPNQMLYKDNITQLLSSSGGNVSVPTAGGTNITLSSSDNSTINVSGPGNYEPGEVSGDTDVMLAGGNIGHTINRVLLPDLSLLGLSSPPPSDMSPPSGGDMSPPSGGDMTPPDQSGMSPPMDSGSGSPPPPAM